MKPSGIELPSNRSFGFFFSAIFAGISIYLYATDATALAHGFSAIGILFFVVTLLKSSLLLPLNWLWMRFGLLLGMIVSPIVLGVMFFGLFTPIAVLMRLAGRDELRLRFKQKASHWIPRDGSSAQSGSFKNQF
jgi:polyferredoxin